MSAVGGSAYRAREKIREERTGVIHDYSDRIDLVYAEILLPENAPSRWKDRYTLWNEVDRTETRCNSRTARQIEFSLPCELDRVQNIILAREITKEFVKEGMVADLTIHEFFNAANVYF